MVERIYLALWILLALFVGIIWISGNLTAVPVVALGFITFGLLFMGLIGVLPNWASHNHESNT